MKHISCEIFTRGLATLNRHRNIWSQVRLSGKCKKARETVFDRGEAQERLQRQSERSPKRLEALKHRFDVNGVLFHDLLNRNLPASMRVTEIIRTPTFSDLPQG